MSATNISLKERVRAFWEENPCGTKFADAKRDSLEFFDRVAEHRYLTEWHIPEAAGFQATKGLAVLEIGCGLGTDGVQFARAGANYTGVDLTEAAINLARQNFSLRQLSGNFRVADAENLDFPSKSFDLIYSHGVLHHTPDPARALKEIYRVLRPGGQAIVMLYHRNSYNYRVNISLLRRLGVRLLRWPAGVKLIHTVTGEPIDSLQAHAKLLKSEGESYLRPEEFLSRNTDGAGNPLARVYSRNEARRLFNHFSEVTLRTFFLNKRWLPLLGRVMPQAVESQFASRWGWHLWIYARK